MGAHMSDQKKKRASMLDTLAAAAPAAPNPMMASNRALRSARDAVDSHSLWELDPWSIDDDRIADRLAPEDVLDLRDAIETNGQTVPILVRRHPEHEGRYLLVYGRRRLEAIRSSGKVNKIRALVAAMDDDAAVRAQISENMARRDLSFIEKALFARELAEQGFGTQSQIAEILTVSKSAISMALGILDTVTPALARAIGAAHGIGRPRWDALARAITDNRINPDALVDVALTTHDKEGETVFDGLSSGIEPSQAAFEAVLRKAGKLRHSPAPPQPLAKTTRRSISLGATDSAVLRHSDKNLRIDLEPGPFAEWIEAHAEDILTDLHARWKTQAED